VAVELRGKIALVTGAGQRVGRAIGLALAQEGCDLVAHYHASATGAQDLSRETERLGVRSAALQADLTDPSSLHQLFAAIDESMGGLDILVNSAAVMVRRDFGDVTDADWHATIDLNLKAAFFCIQRAADRMRRRGGGAIVNIGDVAGARPWPMFPVHSISKAGLDMLTQVAALALAPSIRVNAVAPGPVLRPETMSESRWDATVAALPLARAGSPQDVAAAVLFLLRNDYLTGTTLPVDGGNRLV
jgi:pteridine reductase